MSTKTRIYKVSELTRNIKFILDRQLPPLWLEGEISNLTRHSSGHTYFTLKDESSQIKAVLLKSRNQDLTPSLPLKNGLSILAFGKISVYEKAGNYQIIIDKLEPKGIGALQLAYEELKKRLHKEGLFDPAHKPLPLLPKCIGIVTSPTGAAVRDIINIIIRRFPNIGILLYPVRVQGAGAGEEIAAAIDSLNKLTNIDTLIVGRGGGSLEDLWAFNEECVARSIFRSQIPVISAVGHEIDFTIADFVADVRAATPSEAAEKVIAQKGEFIDRLNFLGHKLQSSLELFLKNLRSRLDRARTSYVFKEPENTLRQYSQRLDELKHHLQKEISHLHKIHCQQTDALSKRLQALNPEAILTRGYSITTTLRNNKIVTNPKQLKPGEELETKVARGRFRSKVEK